MFVIPVDFRKYQILQTQWMKCQIQRNLAGVTLGRQELLLGGRSYPWEAGVTLGWQELPFGGKSYPREAGLSFRSYPWEVFLPSPTCLTKWPITVPFSERIVTLQNIHDTIHRGREKKNLLILYFTTKTMVKLNSKIGCPFENKFSTESLISFCKVFPQLF